jgi:hypothetical protein
MFTTTYFASSFFPATYFAREKNRHHDMIGGDTPRAADAVPHATLERALTLGSVSVSGQPF